MPYFKTVSQLSLRQGSQTQAESDWIRTILQGYADGTIRPNQPINRAELYKVIFEGIKHSRSIKSNLQISYDVKNQPFRDTPLTTQTEWYLPYADIAARTLNGSNFARNYFASHNLRNQQGTFAPSQAVTRAEIIELLYTLHSRDFIQFQ